MDLPQAVRYRPYEEWSQKDYEAIIKKIAQSPWRSRFHVEPRTGLLNDPNGFSYFDGRFHLFYQNWPYGAAHGLKQWVHMTSTDLVHFTETGSRLLPDHPHDSHGAYSGSAYAIDDRLFSFILVMFEMPIGSEHHYRLARGWINKEIFPKFHRY